MKLVKIAGLFMTFAITVVSNAQSDKKTATKSNENVPFDVFVEQFSDIKVLGKPYFERAGTGLLSYSSREFRS
jgi:hypothetical protein